MITLKDLQTTAVNVTRAMSEVENETKEFLKSDLRETYRGKYVRIESPTFDRKTNTDAFGLSWATGELFNTGTQVVYAKLDSNIPYDSDIDARVYNNGYYGGGKDLMYDVKSAVLLFFHFLSDGVYYICKTPSDGKTEWSVQNEHVIDCLPIARFTDRSNTLWMREYLMHIGRGNQNGYPWKYPEANVSITILSKEEYDNAVKECRDVYELSEYERKVERMKQLEKEIADYDNKHK